MPSFDVSCEVDLNEVRNAVEQAQKEVRVRYDLKDSGSTVELNSPKITVVAPHDMALKAVHQIVLEKLAKRGVSLKSIIVDEPVKMGGDKLSQVINLRMNLETDDLKKMVKQIKAKKFKVQSQIQGEQLRITGKKRDILQEVIAFLKSDVKDKDLKFINFRD